MRQQPAQQYCIIAREFQTRKWNLYLCNQVIFLVVNVFAKDMLISVVFQTSSSYRNRQISTFGINQPLLEENKSTKNVRCPMVVVCWYRGRLETVTSHSQPFPDRLAPCLVPAPSCPREGDSLCRSTLTFYHCDKYEMNQSLTILYFPLAGR